MPANLVVPGNEYYPLERYATTKDREEIYAQKDNNQFYLSKSNDEEVMAKQFNSQKELVPYFAVDTNQNPICPLLTKDQKCLIQNVPYPKKSKIERYPKRNQHEYYINRGHGIKYAKNENNDDYCATNSLGKKYYAFKTSEENEEVEFPPSNHKDENTYIEENNTIIYPLNITKNVPVYSKDKDNNEVYFQKNNVEFYGHNKSRLPIYAKDKDGNDRPALRNNVPHYSFFDKNGTVYQYYPKLNDKNEFYIKEGNKEMYAKFAAEERYAQTSTRDDILAQDNNIPYYATDGKNVEFYPKLGGQNFYRREANIEKIALNKSNNEGFYAKNTDDDEFYPKNFNVLPAEEIVIPNVNAPTEPTDDEIKTHVSSRN